MNVDFILQDCLLIWVETVFSDDFQSALSSGAFIDA
jgi:hypothetical protein